MGSLVPADELARDSQVEGEVDHLALLKDRGNKR
jgi:hypothetical protein